MHSLGNDFMVASMDGDAFEPAPEVVRAWGDRRRGVGFDQLLYVQTGGEMPVCRIFNADGSPAGQCGNGARCVAVYLCDHHGAASPVKFLMGETSITAEVCADGSVSAWLPPPAFGAEAAGFSGGHDNGECELPTSAGVLSFGLVSLGNPHAVTVVGEHELSRNFPVGAVGAEIQAMSEFTQGVNVGFMAVERRGRIRLRVVERGCGETMACGSGACAAVAVGRRRNLLDEHVTVALPGGELAIEWGGGAGTMRTTGEVRVAYRGEMEALWTG